MKQIFRHALFALVVAIVAATAARAQFVNSFRASEGLATALKVAQDSLGDANPILTSYSAIVTTINPFGTSTINLQSGKGDVWLYNYYSPSKHQMIAVGVANIPLLGGYQGSGSPEPVDSLDLSPGDTTVIDTAAPYAASEKIFDQIKNDTAFIRHQQQFPGFQPYFMGLANIPTDSIPLTVDPNQPFWTVVWSGEADSSMVCFVAARSGEAYCMRLGNVEAGVPAGAASVAIATLGVTPNPAAGAVRVTVATPASARLQGSELWLFNDRGDRVLNLTASFVAGGYRSAEFDASILPAGVYFCRATGSNWSGIAPVVVTK